MYKRVTPTGVIRYNPDKCWNGLTIIPKLPNQSTAKGAALYDMNGNIVHNGKACMALLTIKCFLVAAFLEQLDMPKDIG